MYRLLMLLLTICLFSCTGKSLEVEESEMIYEMMNTPSNQPAFKFTANNALISITVIPATTYTFENGNGMDTFEDGDNIILRRIHMIMPYQYGGIDFVRTNVIRLVWNQPGGVGTIPIPEIGVFGLLHINPLHKTFSPNIKLQAPGVGQGNFLLEVDQIDVTISQVGGPAVLNAQDIFLGIALELEHTRPML